MKKIISIAGIVAFVVAIGIVGAVEHGACVSRMWLTVPLIAIMGLAARCAEKTERGRKER